MLSPTLPFFITFRYLTIPISSAKAERTFSRLKLINNVLVFDLCVGYEFAGFERCTIHVSSEKKMISLVEFLFNRSMPVGGQLQCLCLFIISCHC